MRDLGRCYRDSRIERSVCGRSLAADKRLRKCAMISGVFAGSTSAEEFQPFSIWPFEGGNPDITVRGNSRHVRLNQRYCANFLQQRAIILEIIALK